MSQTSRTASPPISSLAPPHVTLAPLRVERDPDSRSCSDLRTLVRCPVLEACVLDMDLEEAFQAVGEFGRHQKRMLVVLILLQVTSRVALALACCSQAESSSTRQNHPLELSSSLEQA